LIADGLIKAVEHQISEWSADIQLRDCRGLVLAQGWWICTATLESQGLKSGKRSIACCGSSRRVYAAEHLPDTMPPVDNSAGLALQQKGLGAEKLSPTPHSPYRSVFWAALTVGVQGQQMTELAELAAASGVVGFADGQPLGNLALLRRLLKPEAFGKAGGALAL